MIECINVETRQKLDYVQVLSNIAYHKSTREMGRRLETECENIITFDIETSSGYADSIGRVIPFTHENAKQHKYDKLTPVSLMYHWQVALDNDSEIYYISGRTWYEFQEFLDRLTFEISACINKHNRVRGKKRTDIKFKIKPEVRIYVHNLAFEFQFIRNVFDFNVRGASVFARSMRKTLNARIMHNGCRLVFCDTLALTVKSLKEWTKNLPVAKKSEPGDFYLPIRTPDTPLTEDENGYNENDVVSMVYGMREYKQKYTYLYNIPMTQTGEVRRMCRKVVGQNPQWTQNCMNITSSYKLEDFQRLNFIFAGGWTHANAIYSRKLIGDRVRCFDFTSSYPYCMCSRRFPVGEFEPCTYETIKQVQEEPILDRGWSYYIHFKVTQVDTKTYNTFWSHSKVISDKGVIRDNGKINYAEELELMMTDLDFETFCRAYEFETFEFIEGWIAKSDYLPREIINLILQAYKHKTEYKGIADKDTEYNEAKQLVNSIYGVAVTKIICDLVNFTDNWSKESVAEIPGEFDKQIKKAAGEDNAYLTYQIGCWVTAHARYNLWSLILQLDERVIYGDTDSLKGVFNDNDLIIIENYNKEVDRLVDLACKARNLNPDDYAPKTPAGVAMPLGYFDREADCIEFKTLGAKRYCYKTEDGEIHVTVAGLPKAAGPAKIKSVSEFCEDMVFETDESEKTMGYYCDDQIETEWVDRDGNHWKSYDKYGVAVFPTTFSLGVSNDYDLLLKLMEGSYIQGFSDRTSLLNNYNVALELNKESRKKEKPTYEYFDETYIDSFFYA